MSFLTSPPMSHEPTRYRKVSIPRFCGRKSYTSAGRYHAAPSFSDHLLAFAHPDSDTDFSCRILGLTLLGRYSGICPAASFVHESLRGTVEWCNPFHCSSQAVRGA